MPLRKLSIHIEKLPGKEGGFLATRTCPDFKYNFVRKGVFRFLFGNYKLHLLQKPFFLLRNLFKLLLGKRKECAVLACGGTSFRLLFFEALVLACKKLRFFMHLVLREVHILSITPAVRLGRTAGVMGTRYLPAFLVFDVA